MSTHRPRAPTVKVAVVVLIIACATLAASTVGVRHARAQSPEQGAEARETKPRAGAIYGRAVNEATGKPLRRARISLMTFEGSRVDEGALTDARGEFRIGKLPAGRYVVWAEVNGMLTPTALLSVAGDAGLDPDELRRHFEVVELDGKAEREVTVRARRGGSVTGRVTYADGDPAVGVLVHLLRRGAGVSPSQLARTTSGYTTGPRTDDRGIYRVAGLPPGEYLVAVAEMADHKGTGATDSFTLTEVPGMAELSLGQQLLMTYHPSASSAKGAEAVNVRAGEEQTDVDVTIPERELRTIAGLVRASRGGRPVKGARVSIVPKDEDDGSERAFFDVTGGAQADADGRWRLREIPDGLYTLYARPPEEYESDEPAESLMPRRAENRETAESEEPTRDTPRRRRRFAPTRRELRVSGDVGELVVELGEGARVSGSMVFAGVKTSPYPYIYAVRVAATAEESVDNPTQSAEVGENSFVLEGLAPGKYFLHARSFSEQDRIYVKAITWQGRDLLREPLEVGEGTHIEGVRVVYGNDPGTLDVRVSRADKLPGYNVNVFLLPADMSRWSVFAPQLFCATDGEGFCRLSVPPGDYLVVTSPPDGFTVSPEQELRRRALNAPHITLRPNDQKTFDTVVKE